MSTTKKGPACEACHALKIRCDKAGRLEVNNGQRCSRCVRLDLKCVPANRRRPRERITELEAEIAGLTRALRDQARLNEQLQDQAQVMEKRTVLDGKTTLCPLFRPDMETDPPPSSEATLAILDATVPKDLQKKGMKHYIDNSMAMLPAVPITEDDYGRLREECPILLLVVLGCAASGILKEETQQQLIGEAMHVIGMDLIGCGYRSLRYIQTLLVASFWFRSTANTKHASVSQLVHLATNMAVDIGISGPDITFDLRGGAKASIEHMSIASRRTWLACLLATSAMSMTMRRGDVSSWTAYEEDCLNVISCSGEALPTDAYFCQLVKATRVSDKIVVQLEMFDAGRIWNLDAATYSSIVTQSKIEIDACIESIPSTLTSNWLLKLSNAVNAVHLYEPILHTYSNKLSFAAPYLPNRIAAGSFAAPTVTLDHVTALYTLNDACQRVLMTVAEPNTATMLAVSAIVTIPRITYVLFVLLKLYVALTAPGNTYGRILARDQLLVDQHLDDLVALYEAMEKIDPTSFNTKMLLVAKWHKQWYTGYATFVTQHEGPRAVNDQPLMHRHEVAANEETVLSDIGSVDVNPWESTGWNLAGFADEDMTFLEDFHFLDGGNIGLY